MKKCIMSLVLALTLTLALVPSVTPSAQAANHNVSSSSELLHAKNTAQSGDTIILTANINYDSLLEIKNTDININLNGNTLNIKSDMGALSVDNCKVEIYGGTLNVESTTNTALYVSGGAKITLTGNLKGEDSGIFIPSRSGGGTVTVNGDVSGNFRAITANDGGKVTINGNLSGGNGGIWSCDPGTEVTVYGNVRVTGSGSDEDSSGVSAMGGGTVTVNGDVTVSGSKRINSGVRATTFFGVGGSKATINGNVNVSGAKQTNNGVYADYADVMVSGDVNTSGAEVNSGVSAFFSSVAINGSVVGRVFGDTASTIKIGGNLIGEVKGDVTVVGTINGESQSTPDPEPPAEAPNLDTASGWAKEPLTAAIAKGFVPADLQDKYQDTITRAEFCRLAVSWVEMKTGKTIDAVMTEKGVSRDPNAFTDTNDPAILAAFALGITSGVGNNQFNPNSTFTREQAAGMILNVGKVIGMDASNVPPSGFADIADVSSWCVDGVNFVKANGIMQGDNNQFNPKGEYTREQSIITFSNIK